MTSELQRTHQEFRRSVDAAIAAARSTGVADDEISYGLRSAAAEATKRWHAEGKRRNAQHIAENEAAAARQNTQRIESMTPTPLVARDSAEVAHHDQHTRIVT